MKHRSLSLIAILTLTLACVAPVAYAQQQDQPPIDAFLGYSRTSNFDTSLNGWILSGNLNWAATSALKAISAGTTEIMAWVAFL